MFYLAGLIQRAVWKGNFPSLHRSARHSSDSILSLYVYISIHTILAPLLPFRYKLMVLTVEDLCSACHSLFSVESGTRCVWHVKSAFTAHSKVFHQTSSHCPLIPRRNSHQLSSQPSHCSPSNPSTGHHVYKKTTGKLLCCHYITNSAQHVFLLHSSGFIQYKILPFPKSVPEGALNLPE